MYISGDGGYNTVTSVIPEEPDERPKAVALLSGGLDSTLAVLVLKELGVDVTALTFITPFGCDVSDNSSCSHDPFPAAEKYGFRVKLCSLGEEFVKIVMKPEFGHGRNMNPCIDCRILMLKEAKKFMELIGADFLVTGEVVGQRPMSQRRECFPLIDKKAGVEGLVVRPLTAKNLPPTIPERKGQIDREKLLGIKGRSRKPQMALAERFQLEDYPTPAGGCLLTEPAYAARLKDLLEHNGGRMPSSRDISLLRVGRHFRLSPEFKAVVGRNEEENGLISRICQGNILMEVPGWGSPVTALIGSGGGEGEGGKFETSQPPPEEVVILAASLTARYSDANRLSVVEVEIKVEGRELRKVAVKPAEDALTAKLNVVNAIGKSPKRKKRYRKKKGVNRSNVSEITRANKGEKRRP